MMAQNITRLPVPQYGYFDSYAGADIKAFISVEGQPYHFAEMHTISYSIHREKGVVRSLNHVNPKGYTYGPRTIAGSMIFIAFDEDMIYRAMRHLVEAGAHVLPDEMPPFHVTVHFANEAGARSQLSIYNITVVDNGQVMSVEDLVTENTLSYFASDIDLMRVFQSKSRPMRAETKEKLLSTQRAALMQTSYTLDQHTVAGRVLSLNGTPLAGARVIVGSYVPPTVSDLNGEFFFYYPNRTNETLPVKVWYSGQIYDTGGSIRLSSAKLDVNLGDLAIPVQHIDEVIRGIILGKNGQQLPGANVAAILADGQVITRKTNIEGRFEIPLGDQPIVSIEVLAPGHKVKRLPLSEAQSDLGVIRLEAA